MQLSLPVILFDYEGSPFAQKIRLLLTVAGIPFKSCTQPSILPRPLLDSLDIKYRRIPILAIGKDIYCDTICIIDSIQKHFPEKRLIESNADPAYEAFGKRTFANALLLVPVSVFGEGFLRDRESIFPVLKRPDFEHLGPTALGEWMNVLDIVENQFLASETPFIGGDKCSLADIHVAWIINWVMVTHKIGRKPGFGPEIFPRTHAWLGRFPKPEYSTISEKEAKETILGSRYIFPSVEVHEADPLGKWADTNVCVETIDDQVGLNKQYGEFIGSTKREIVIRLENTLCLHFPRLGIIVKRAEDS
ncbi:hypothetical protein K402DRAFT_462034 [Aulographum hederae CBS 113979]|uniref:Uncharacterized protein n=1 Tax=Aulographum hederae CBS 113979 TaxID=1176131 RepID=A0A6G1H6G9_9PEZI|nr:hypothetical protein K402DRAFT_462034 [Aulographum hederae CBS 113979]